MKILKSGVFFSFLLVFFFLPELLGVSVDAQNNLDLTNYIAGPSLVGNDYQLSTGENIRYAAEGGGIRMYKNSNYEQFLLPGGGIYRREDTSWAPLPGFQPAHCSGGDQAVYTIESGCTSHAPGDNLTSDGAFWAPATGSLNQEWSTSFQIIPINNAVLSSTGNRVYCSLSDLSGYPACTSTQLALDGFWGPNQYTFCTGIQNEANLIRIRILAGPGAGDTFFFMEGWGLVGFEAPGFQAGLMGPGANASGCLTPGGTSGGQFPDNAIPQPYVPCYETREPEFHSLRPYQASPCNQSISDIALFCGNDILIPDNITITPSGSSYSSSVGTLTVTGPICTGSSCTCEPSADGATERCEFLIQGIEKDIAIDVSGSFLPIMGNTELVTNSQSQPNPEGLTEAQKVNEYVSWYLNGVNDRAEYNYLDTSKNCIGETSGRAGICKPTIGGGVCLDSIVPPAATPLVPDGKELCISQNPLFPARCCVNPISEPVDMLDRDRVVNFSGPLKKLLSFESQQRIRVDEADDAYNSDTGGGLHLGRQVPVDDENLRHNQVAACTYELTVRIPPLIGPEITLGGVPVPCYGSGIADNIKTQYRLADWVIEEKLPPDPLDPAFDNFLDYWEAYREWRGQFCTQFDVPQVLPFIGGSHYFLCFDDPLNANTWSNLFPYIPFSSTEDRRGEIEVTTVDPQSAASDLTLSNVQFLDQIPAALFFAHMSEANELSDLLQQTFVAKDGAKDDLSTTFTEPPPYCDVREVRSNPGDNLFPGEISGRLLYDANATCTFPLTSGDPFSEPTCAANYTDPSSGGTPQCVPSGWSCPQEFGTHDCGTGFKCGFACGPPAASCSFDYNIRLSTITKTPLADKVWARTVAGPASIFKRWIPQIGDPSSPLAEILDIPAASPVTFRDTINNTNLQVVNPATPPRQPELYFPHIGGIHQYFLKCMQTLFRPQGFGESCRAGSTASFPITPPTGQQCPTVSDSAIPDEWLGQFKQNFINLANNWCAVGGDNLADECYNHVVRSSLDAGINPAFTLTIWVNETAASNYQCSGATAQDFGVNDSSIYQNYNAQLSRFLALPTAAGYTSCRTQCQGTPGCDDPLFAFLTRFRAGGCNLAQDSSNPGFNYYNDILGFTWPLVVGVGNCTDSNGFSINWPTDNSCP